MANGLGNLVSRVVKLNEGIGKVRNVKEPKNQRIKNLDKLFKEIKFKEILDEIWQQVAWANKYIEEKKLWELVKTNPKEGKKVLAELLSLISEIGEANCAFYARNFGENFKATKNSKKRTAIPALDTIKIICYDILSGQIKRKEVE